MRRIRVLAFIIGMNNGGAQKLLLDNAVHFFDDTEIDFTICSIYKYNNLSSYEMELRRRGIKIYYVVSLFDKVFFRLFPEQKRTRLIKLCKRKIAKFNPDIVHVHLCGAMQYAAQAAADCNVPVRFYSLHSNPFRQTGDMLSAIQVAFMRQSFIAICLNNLQYYQARDYYHINRYEILRNGIDFKAIRENVVPKKIARRQFSLNDNEFVISCVGRLDPVKNCSFMLDVMSLIVMKKSDSKLIFAGDGTERQMLENKAELLGIRQNVQFLGNLRNVVPVYCASDVFCLPSISEASPLVLLEAQAVSLYSVVSSGVPEESIITNKVCRMRDGASAEEWAEALLNKDFIGVPVCTESDCDVNTATKNLKALYTKYYDDSKKKMKNKYFIITVDTEADNQWDYNAPITMNNTKYLPRFQELCEKYFFVPVWLTTWEMACDDEFVKYFKEKQDKGLCEIGMHLHAWSTPPEYKLEKKKCERPFVYEYPENIIEQKVINLTDLLKQKFGTAPVTHRAGRWAFNELYAVCLKKHGYLVDCSVTPGIDWSKTKGNTGANGPDFRKEPHSAYNYRNTGLLEIPLSITKNRFFDLNRITMKYGFHYFFGTLKFECFHFLKGKLQWLRPDSDLSFKSLKKLVDKNYKSETDYLMFMIHSSELMPGGSPNFSTNESIEKLYELMNKLFGYIKELGYVGISMKEYEDLTDHNSNV